MPIHDLLRLWRDGSVAGIRNVDVADWAHGPLS